jgi:hypothetical protein
MLDKTLGYEAATWRRTPPELLCDHPSWLRLKSDMGRDDAGNQGSYFRQVSK